MLTLKVITENTDEVIRRLARKHFDAKEVINKIIELDKTRRATQADLDANLAEMNSISKSVGALMKEGKKAEAEEAKSKVAGLKEAAKSLQTTMDDAMSQIQTLLYTIPNMPYDEVPDGKTAEDNVVVKMGNEIPNLGENALPHWDLAKKYNLIDFELGVKISGAGFPVYIGKGAQLQRALINFFLAEANKSGYTEIMPPTVVNQASGYGTGQLPDKEGQMYYANADGLYMISTAPSTNLPWSVSSILKMKSPPACFAIRNS